MKELVNEIKKTRAGQSEVNEDSSQIAGRSTPRVDMSSTRVPGLTWKRTGDRRTRTSHVRGEGSSEKSQQSSSQKVCEEEKTEIDIIVESVAHHSPKSHDGQRTGRSRHEAEDERSAASKVWGEECWARVFTARLCQLSIGSMSYMGMLPRASTGLYHHSTL
jgi:hypothetical protein